MTLYRETLVDRLVHIYGFENDIVVAFCEICEAWANNEWNNHLLTLLVEAHEADPFMEEKDV